jgi:histidine ammonia-lyase
VSDPDHSAPPLVLDGESLTLADLARIARDPRSRLAIAPAALDRLGAGWAEIEGIVGRYRAAYARLESGDALAEMSPEDQPVLDYGVTTGFGEFKNIPVEPEELEELQRNLLLSHSVGVGDSADADDPANYYEADVVRAVLVIRLNAFLKGFSGVRPELARAIQAMVERGIVPLVPLKGSVGSSGDLCPLAHLFATFLGAGRYFVMAEPGMLRVPAARWKPAGDLAGDLGVEVPKPSFKEGLALINGTTFSAALLALAVHDAERAAAVADAAAALALEAVCGCARALDPRIHAARGQAGQIASAAALRRLLAGSRLLERAGAVQDVYSLRCAPAVHGAARDAIAYARAVALCEVNAATDNPLFFPGDPDCDAAAPPWDHQFRANWPAGYRGDLRLSYSAGNFHGEPVGMAADVLAIGLAELADISERRSQMLLDCHHNRNLPANLIARRGVNSGLMIVQYCAASLVSENKVLAHPASVDSIPTSANAEDHNAMASIAARKVRTVLRNVQAVLAIELLVAAQAIEWRVAMEIDPTGQPLPIERSARLAAAATQAAEFRRGTTPERRPGIAAHLGRGTRRVYLAVRDLAPPMYEDRTLDGDIRALRAALEDGSLADALEAGDT